MSYSSRLHTLSKGAEANPPLLFTNPFWYVPHPLCVEAAKEVRAYVEGQEEWEDELLKGKMFGVMVVRINGGNGNYGINGSYGNNGNYGNNGKASDDSGRLYYLAAFSGQLNGESDVEGFVPQLFDVTKSDYFQREMHEIEQMRDDKAGRRDRSEGLQDWLFRQYRCLNARGEEKDLIEIFTDYYKSKMLRQENFEKNAASHHIPSGSGDCCAPKLLQYAYQHDLQPVCMAEFWIQKDTRLRETCHEMSYTEVRRNGRFYPACRKKCRPILLFMLEGLEVEESHLERRDAALLNQVKVVYEDAQLLVIDKPSGLLSVPGRGGEKSVADWIGLHHPLPAYWFVHRLDQDTHGLLLIAKDDATYKELQQQFIRHEVKKTYEALVDGDVIGDEGKIKLRMRPDPDDPPRQIVDQKHGKQAVTRWKVIERRDGQTVVELYPDTGRTHQLRVHCAHPQGLNAPIHGDKLYGADNSPKDMLCLCAKKTVVKIGESTMVFEI